jgi:hypothetical protein
MELDIKQLALCRDKDLLGSKGSYRSRDIITRISERRTRAGNLFNH